MLNGNFFGQNEREKRRSKSEEGLILRELIKEYKSLYSSYLKTLIGTKKSNIALEEEKLRRLEELIDEFPYIEKLDCWAEIRAGEVRNKREFSPDFGNTFSVIYRKVSRFVKNLIGRFSQERKKKNLLNRVYEEFSDIFWKRFIGIKY